MSDNNKAEWMNDPALAGIDSYKLEFLQALVFEGRNLKQNQMLPFLMAVTKRGQERNISFTNGEMETIFSVLKNHANPGELDMLNKVMAMRKSSK